MDVDNITKEYVKDKVERKYDIMKSDEDAKFEEVHEFNSKEIEPKHI